MAYFHISWVLKLLTSHKCHCSYLVQICDSNHAHFLMSFRWSQLLANGRPYRARNGGPTWPEHHFLIPICAKEERNGPPRGFLQLSPETAMPFAPFGCTTPPPPPPPPPHPHPPPRPPHHHPTNPTRIHICRNLLVLKTDYRDGPQLAPPGRPCTCLPPSLLELSKWGEIRVVLQHAGDA